MVATGRKTVAPGQPIASDWGNTVFDQSVVHFSSATDRDTQWPTPQLGSVCYTETEGAWWGFKAGGWQALYPLLTVAANRPLGNIVGSFNGNKTCREYVGWATMATDASGYFAVPVPAGATCVMSAIFQPVETAGQDQNYYVVIRVSSSNLTVLQCQARRGATGAAAPSINVAFSYHMTYQ